MPRQGKDFELAYKDLYELDKEKYTVTSPAMLYDKVAGIKREIDVLVEYKDDEGKEIKLGIECRDRMSVQSVDWVEQLIVKKKDVELDYLIITTTSELSKALVNKAKANGIFIELAENIIKERVQALTDEFKIENYYIECEVVELNVLVNNRTKKLDDFNVKLNIVEIEELKRDLIYNFLTPINYSEVIEKQYFEGRDFFKKDGTETEISLFFTECLGVIQKLFDRDIKALSVKLKIKLHKKIVPLSKSLSVFWKEEKTNKDYSAFFDSEDYKLEIGYIANAKKIYIKQRMKPVEDLKYIGSQMHINTVFPNDYEMEYDVFDDDVFKTVIGSFKVNKSLRNLM